MQIRAALGLASSLAALIGLVIVADWLSRPAENAALSRPAEPAAPPELAENPLTDVDAVPSDDGARQEALPATSPSREPEELAEEREANLGELPAPAKGPELWAVKYAGFSGPDMQYERDLLSTDIGTQVLARAGELFDAGIYEIIGNGPTPSPDAYDLLGKLGAFRDTPEGLHMRVVLDERQHEELYELSREIAWLNKRAQEWMLEHTGAPRGGGHLRADDVGRDER